MTALLAITRWLLVGFLPCTAPDDVSKEPIEIDFAPLPLAAQTDYALDYDFHNHSDNSLFGVVHMTTETPSEVRDYFQKKLERTGWVVKAQGDTQLIVYGKKDDPIQKVKFKVDAFEFKPKKDVTPTVKRVQKA